MSRYTNIFCIFGKYMTNNVPVMLSPITEPTIIKQNVRYIRKHWNPKYKKLRAEKFIKIELPDFHKDPDVSAEETRSHMKKKGLAPPRSWQEMGVFLSTTGNVYEAYVPPEGDGKFSAITKEGAKQKFEFLQKKSKSVMSVRKIKSFDEEFNPRDFIETAMDVYLKAHETLTKGKREDLSLYATEKAYLEMLHNTERKIFRWKFLQSLEPARVVHVRCTSMLTKTNVFAQITVRFHTQQILAIYDRFGRLMHGSETIPKDVLEYVVFEKHLANQYGTWRIHAKIIPPWMEPQQTNRKTFIVPKEAEPEPDRTPDTVYTPPEQSENVTTKVEPNTSR